MKKYEIIAITVRNPNINSIIPDNFPATLKLIDLTGQIVEILPDDSLNPGEHLIPVEVSDLHPGIYVCILQTAHQSVVQKIIIP